MKIYIHAQQYWKTDYGIWSERKKQREVLQAFDRDIEVDAFKSSFGNKWQIEINQEIYFNQSIVDYINEHYDEVEIKLISYITADLSCEKSLKEAIERERKALTFFEDQAKKVHNPNKISKIGKTHC